MARAARILVLGEDPHFEAELLEHREIDTRWARTAAEAVAELQRGPVDACVVAPGFDDREVVWLIRKSVGRAPCLVVVDDARSRATWPPDHATAVIPREEVDSVVLLLAQHTGLRLARYPRADIAAPVMVHFHGRAYERMTRDLSLSGVAVEDFPKAPLGARVELVMDLGGRSAHVSARLIRWYEEDGRRIAGLNFYDMAESPRALIHAAVQEALDHRPDQWEIDGLFSDLALDDFSGCQALSTRDVARSPRPAFLPRTADLEIPTVRALLEGTMREAEAPAWLVHLVRDLTRLEAAAARGRPAPPWAEATLQLRINLARVRARFPDRAPPSALIDDAYRMFERLHRETAGETGAIRKQVQHIRAALLRDMTLTPRTDDVEAKAT